MPVTPELFFTKAQPRILLVPVPVAAVAIVLPAADSSKNTAPPALRVIVLPSVSVVPAPSVTVLAVPAATVRLPMFWLPEVRDSAPPPSVVPEVEPSAPPVMLSVPPVMLVAPV